MMDFRNLYNYYCNSVFCKNCNKMYNSNYYYKKHIFTNKHLKNRINIHTNGQ